MRHPPQRGFLHKRLKGLEPSTFCMASRRSSQLSYSRANPEYKAGLDRQGRGGGRGWVPGGAVSWTWSGS
jgi:hypothetical protein